MKFEPSWSLAPAGLRAFGRLALPSLMALGMATACWAQGAPRVATGNSADNPNWQEEAVPPPPAFVQERVKPLTMPLHITVSVGIDPETVQVGNDGVVRYVAVMRNASGSVNAVYEGIRCATDEVKTYARFGSSGQWSMVTSSDWKPVNGNQPSRHAMVFARELACPNHVPDRREDIVRALSQPNFGKPRNTSN